MRNYRFLAQFTILIREATNKTAEREVNPSLDMIFADQFSVTSYFNFTFVVDSFYFGYKVINIKKTEI